MTGTIVNVITVFIGSLIGLQFHSKIPEKYIHIAFQGIGIFTLVFGFGMALKSQEQMVMIFSIIFGSITGEWLDLDKRINDLSTKLKKLVKSENETFTDGLITSFLIFCMGSMTILGAIEEGIQGNSELLLTKSAMDGFASMALASTLGIGVLFSIIPLFIFQGGLTVLAMFLQNLLTQEIITELSATGGLLLIALGLNLLEIKKIKVTNMLPSLVYCVLFMVIVGKIFT